MSWAPSNIFLSKCEEVIPYDTTLPINGAPGLPGELRKCNAELASGAMVLQTRKLCLLQLAAGTSVVKGSLLELKAGSYYIADALAAASATKNKCAGFVSEKINENKAADLAQGVLPTAYWVWLVVQGPVDAIADANLAIETELVSVAASGAGRLDDTAISTAVLANAVVAMALEAVTGGAGTSFEANAKIL